jgi:hypothetical protein
VARREEPARPPVLLEPPHPPAGARALAGAQQQAGVFVVDEAGAGRRRLGCQLQLLPLLPLLLLLLLPLRRVGRVCGAPRRAVARRAVAERLGVHRHPGAGFWGVGIGRGRHWLRLLLLLLLLLLLFLLFLLPLLLLLLLLLPAVR